MTNIFTRFPSLAHVPHDKFPGHICIIPDGNGRWAKQHNVGITQGHTKGFSVAQTLLHDIAEIPEIKICTIWGFSADNWKRNKAEVAGLMMIFDQAIHKIRKECKKTHRRFIHLGRKDRIPLPLVSLIEKVEKETQENVKQTICLALDFGGEDQEIRLLEKARELPLDKKIDQDVLWQLRDGKGVIPSADLLIRTSGEMRTSDIGWLNGAPTELYFLQKHFPDMTTNDLVEAIVVFSKRERRLGARPN